MEHLPEQIYLTTVGGITFLCIQDEHMWPVNSIKHVNMQNDKATTVIQFDGAQSWTFMGADSDTVRLLLSKNHRVEQSLADRIGA